MKRIHIWSLVIAISGFLMSCTSENDPEKVFLNPPDDAKPGVLWMWMGSNITKEGITRDLETLRDAGFSRTTMFSLADITTSLSAEIGNRPGPEIISWTDPWWEMVRYAAEESKRLGLDFGMFNCPGYETSGGTWITPELSMQDLCWSEIHVNGNKRLSLKLEKPAVDPRSAHPFPHYNRETGAEERPVIDARKTYYRDVAVIAVPDGRPSAGDITDISDKMQPDGTVDWEAPAGGWTIYRFGHTTKGALIFPAQWQAAGLECDKMSRKAVEFHIDHVISEIKKHLGDLAGTAFTHVHFDSYEASMPGWTPGMREEFRQRRGYDLTPWLPVFAGKRVGTSADSLKFREDFMQTIKDLHRDVYYKTLSEKLADAGLTFLCEPYGGPWDNMEIMPLVHNVMTEFWTDNGKFKPFMLEPTVVALRKAGKNLIEAEAMSGQPSYSRWSEYPAWLKPVADGAYCAGVNRFIVHRFVHQPFEEKYKPGATMGQWGTHFDRTQTWWEPGKAMFRYWQKCQALLQWGSIDETENDFKASGISGEIELGHIHRRDGDTHVFFVANTSHNSGNAVCSFAVTGMKPELWDPVTGAMRDLQAYTDSGALTEIPIQFQDAQSFFIVFRKKSRNSGSGSSNFPEYKEKLVINGPWQVSFDPAWGGPAEPVTFVALDDWTKREEPGIRYFSGTAVYRTEFSFEGKISGKDDIYIDLGVVNHIARVKLNGKDLGVIWTAPWNIRVPSGALEKENRLEVEVTNVWANRLIGDEQEPPDAEWLPCYSGYKSGWWMKEFPSWFINNQPRPSKNRYTFTTWNYFTKDSPLISSGLLGPVRLMMTED